ncbi:LOW QUALITY PROTEIN: sushi, von Willebrand factor type A, EGF and pentraxin domain-containing protein 1-like [Diadema setosum]|uniref:LOW QUALITY PROTEIN: sushi, von Willebrand factor type A, EGF and pentraxin domain-containing protein 1-like n=1 Tax=Diadema setosum TaxID=31175 RepID=UPI003B3AF475
MARHLSLTVLCGLSVLFLVFDPARATNQCSAEGFSSGSYNVSDGRNPVYTPSSTQQYSHGTDILVICGQFLPWIATTCLNGTWSRPWPTCGGCMPNSATNGYYQIAFPKDEEFQNTSSMGYTDGSEIAVRVECDTGFRPESERYTTCVNEAWSVQWPTCRPIPKCMPQSTTVGRYTVEERFDQISTAPDEEGYTDGSSLKVRVTCNEGYRNQPLRLTTCQNGNWSRPWPTCEVLKCLPPANQGGSYSVSTIGMWTPSTEGYRHGDALNVSIVCTDGYRIQPNQSTVSTFCQEGSWTIPWPTCEIRKCTQPTTPSGIYSVFLPHSSEQVTNEYTDGGTYVVVIECNPGYQIHSSQPISRVWSRCDDGEWSRQWPTCDVLKCSPPVPSFGLYRVSLDETSAFQTPSADGYVHDVTLQVRVECDAGYRSQPRESTVSSTCRDGLWSEQWPTCVELARCSRQNEQTSGITVQTRNVIASSRSGTWEDYPHGSEIEVTCSLGYTPKDRVTMVCNDGQWSESWPRCEILKCMPPTTPTGNYRASFSTYPYQRAPSDQGYTHSEEFWVSIECNAGYHSRPTQSQYTWRWVSCQDGNWSRPWPTCDFRGGGKVDPHFCGTEVSQVTTVSTQCVPIGGLYQDLLPHPWGYEDPVSLHENAIFDREGVSARPKIPDLLGLLSCSTSEEPKTTMSSAIPMTPGHPSKITSIFAWNISCDTFRPKGSLLKQYRPSGELNVVRRLDSLSRTILQFTVPCWGISAPLYAKSRVLLLEIRETVAAAVLFKGLRREVASNGTVVVFPINRPGSSWGNKLYVHCKIQIRSWSRPVITASSVTTSQRQRDITLTWPTWRNSGNFTCTLDGSNHTVEVLFNELYCPEPVINHGSVVKSFEWTPGRYPIIQRITFECDDEYRLPLSRVYTPYHTCVLGRWSDEIPQCEPYLCPEPVVPSNGRIHVVTSSRRAIGARLEFFCSSGYYLVGLSNERECESNAQWSDDFPTCEAVPVRPRSPCESVTCEDSWKKCTVLYSGEAACTCINPFDCPYEPDAGIICGTDGRNYTSVCQLKARACLLRLIVEVAADNAVCIYGLPEGEEVERINDYSNSESGSFSWDDSTVTEGQQSSVTEGQHTSRTPTVAHQQTPPQGDGGEPTQEVTGASASVEATRTPQTTANGGGSEGNLFWDTTTDLWDSFPTDSHWELTTES